tara:strand:- start:230 stop:481 length:252 start_codon:yes stop_codon:yes gene_type:complete
MKRSEMVQKISDILTGLYGQDLYNYKVAKDILVMQELCGMLPPESPKYHNDKYAVDLGYGSADDYRYETGDAIELYEWENENE